MKKREESPLKGKGGFGQHETGNHLLKNMGHKLLRATVVLTAILFCGNASLKAQKNYVFYNGTYGYLYNDNGTLKSSKTLQYGATSAWTASGTLGTTGRTIVSYTNTVLYLHTNQNNGGTVSLEENDNTWQMRDSYLCVRPGRTSYYLKATSATTFTTASGNNGNQYAPYEVTITDIASGLSSFTISGNRSVNTTGTYYYTHTDATYCVNAYTDYYFSSSHHYVNTSNVSSSSISTTSVTSGYTWSLSANATGYAKVNDSTGAVTVTTFPSQKTTITLYCTVIYSGDTGVTSFPIQLALTGVTNGTVTLDDREDHNWTYYSGVDASVDGGDYNTNYAGKLYSPNPRNVKITYKANGGAVSIDESETEFVYYKTLEQGSTTGQYPYTVISNPFSKRPNGKGFGGWKITSGADYIQGHRANDVLALDEDITFVNLPYASVNSTSAEIVLEATWVNLNNITYASDNTFTYNVSGGNYETNILVLKRNVTGTITTTSPVTIMMVEPDGSSDYRNTYTFSGNITPNNSGVTKIEFTKWNSTNTLNCNNHSVTVGRGMTTTSQCASYVTGVTGSTSNQGRTTYSSNLNYHLKLESGTFTDVSFIAGTEGTAGYVTCNGTSNQVKGTLGNDYDRAKSDSTNLTISDELFLGYRPTYANGNQNNANFTCWVKSGNLCSGTNVTNTTFDGNDKPTGGYYGDASQTFYVSVGGTQTYIGKRKLYVEGGILSGIAGGIDANNNASDETFFVRMTGGQVRGVVYGSGAFAASSGIRRFIITGGTINGWVAAGCNGTDPTQSGGTLPSNTYVYIGGTSHIGNTTDLTLNTSSDGNVFGAGSGNSAQATTGQVNNSNVVIADECYVKNNVYGGGNYGYSNATATVYVTGGEVNGSVFGGSNQKQGVNVEVNMTGGQVDAGVYGGSNVTGTISGSVTMNINGGQVGTSSSNANIHGGGYGNDTRVSGNVDITLGETNQTTDGVTVYGDVYGGSALGYVNGTTANTTYHTYVTLNKGTINGSLYGGGLGDNSTAANVYAPVKVTVNGGQVTGAVFGCNNINGSPQQKVDVIINGTESTTTSGGTKTYALQGVYGGGNLAHYDYDNASYPTVTVNGCSTSIKDVYGGGNAAAVPSTHVTINGGDIDRVFGGGNGESGTPAHVGYKNKTENSTASAYSANGNVTLDINGGTINQLFGGSNAHGTIKGSIGIDIAKSGTCEMHIGEVYGGGNEADGNAGSISIACTGDEGEGIGDVYGGANKANIGTSTSASNIKLEITGGSIERVFGGNNTSGDIYGTIQVDVNWDDELSCGYNYLGSVFGGGNKANYSGTPDVNVIKGTVSHSVYGGGNEAGVAGGDVSMTGGTVKEGIYGGCNTSGTVSGDIDISITGGTVGVDATQTANIHGGGYGASTETAGDVRVTINGSGVTVWGDVYGGSALGNVNNTSDTTFVTLTDGTVYGCLYGGGLGDASNAALVNGNVIVRVDGGKVQSTAATDRTTGAVFGCNNVNGTPKGNVEVAINSTSATVVNGGTKTYALQGVYGGGNLANYDPTTPGNYPTVTINGCSTSIKDVYGGGNAAAVPYTMVTINGGDIDRVFAGGNGESGTPAHVGWKNKDANPTTNSYGTGNANALIKGGTINQIFGGSNSNGVIRGAMSVTIDQDGSCRLDIKELYGGGNAAASQGGTLTVACTDDGYIDYLYGGANQANVDGDITLNITGGRIGNVFGGNNQSGAVNGKITVNVNWDNSCPKNYLGNVYGGGNLATYSAPSGYTDYPQVNIINGTVTYNVYGGGKGDPNDDTKGVITGNPQVTIGSSTTTHVSKVLGDVFGGGDAAAITGNTNVQVLHQASVGGNVYGGGNAAPVSGNTEVLFNHRAKVYGNVYGGGNKGEVGGDTKVIVNSQQ